VNADLEWARVRLVFEEACERSGAERTRYLDQACGGDAALREQVEVLLSQDDRFPDETRIRDSTTAPERIGRYRIIERVGEGGVGIVYRAEQDEPRRTVALKVLRSPMPHAAVRERFRREAAILGRLEHPGIARIFEASTSETDQGDIPFFAMEFVSGRTITAEVGERDLPMRERLELLAKVADALHAAHEKGIVHRDIKPANVLVDARSEPRIVDFGVAVALQDDEHRCTRTGQLVGTLSYMSPEQLESNLDTIDTRSDIYALGLLAYEVLSGRPAFSLEQRSLSEMVRTVREVEPPRLGRLVRSLRGDVETIVGKAIAKERELRYASAAEFASDIRRYLRGEPITARPASGLYHLRRFAGRNRITVSAGALLLVGLVVLVATISSQRAVLRREEELGRAFSRMFDAMQASLKELEGGAPLADVVDRMISRRYDLAYEEPDVQIHVLSSWAGFCESFRLYDRSVELFRQVLALDAEHYGPMHGRTIYIAVRLCNPLYQARRFDELEAHARLWFERCREAFGTEDENTLRFRSTLAMALTGGGHWAEAANELERVIETRERIQGGYHSDLGRDWMNLARLKLRSGEFARALELATRTRRENAARFEVGNTLTVEADVIAGAACVELGRPAAEAAQHFSAAREGIDANPGGNDRNELDLRFWSAKALEREGRPEEALSRMRDLEEDARRQVGDTGRRLGVYRAYIESLQEAVPLGGR